MTKPYLKNKLNIFFIILEIILIVSSVLLNRLSFKKMGLMRHLVFKNYMYDRSKIYFLILSLIILLIFIYVFYIFKYKFKFKTLFFIIFLSITFLSLNKCIKIFKYDYYFQSFIFLTITFIEILKIYFTNKKEKI